jgi:MFS family permease
MKPKTAGARLATPTSATFQSAKPSDIDRSLPVGMLVVLLSAAFLAQFDFFVVNIAAPALQADIGATRMSVELIIGGYAFGLASGMITGGRLGDMFGHRRLFAIGIACFGLTSLLCGVAMTPAQLVAARVLQGLAAAAMMPQILGTITAAFLPAIRARAIALFAVVSGIGAIAGQLLGALLLSADIAGLGWRIIFLVNLPICIVAALLAPRILPMTKSQASARLDLVGAFGLCLALALILVPLSLGYGEGWPLWAWVSILFGLLLILAVVSWERRLARRGGAPVLDVSLFGLPSFQSGIVASAGCYIYFSSLLFTVTQFIERGTGLDPVQAGLAFTPMGIGFMATSFAGRGLAARYGADSLIAGTLVAASGSAVIALAVRLDGVDTGLFWLCLGMLLNGSGNGLVMPSLTGLSLLDVPVEKAGAASGVLTTAQQFASAGGIATIGAVFLAWAGSGGSGETYAQAMVISAILCLVMQLIVMRMILGIRRRQRGETS